VIKLPDELLDELELDELELDEELELLEELELELDEELVLPEEELELDELEDELLLELEEDELGSTCPPPQPLIIDAKNKEAVPSTKLFGTID
jgi:hypothetical protein